MADKSEEHIEDGLRDEINSNIDMSTAVSFEELMHIASKTVVETCMEIRSHESVLVIADPSTSEIGQELYKVASQISENVLLIIKAGTLNTNSKIRKFFQNSKFHLALACY